MTRSDTWIRRATIPALAIGFWGVAATTPAYAGTSPSTPDSGTTEAATIAPQPTGLTATPNADCVDRPAHPNYNNDAELLPDVATGAPRRDTPDATDSGAVELRYSNGSVVTLTVPTPQAGELFGTSIMTTDFNADGCDDLIVGAPGHTVDGVEGAGAIHFFTGTTGGPPQYVGMLSMANPMIPGEPTEGAEFGAALDAYLEQDAPDRPMVHLYLGAPGLTVDGEADAGGVFEIGLTYTEELNAHGVLTTLGSDGVPGFPEAGDRLGASVAANGTAWAAGAPGGSVLGQQGAGLVIQTDDARETFWLLHQGKFGIQGNYEPGDNFGAALDYDTDQRLVIGVPGEDVGSTVDAGMVNITAPTSGDDPTPRGVAAFTQNTPDDGAGDPVAGAAETDDRFGSAVLTWPNRGSDDAQDYVYVGVPGEAIGSVEAAGMVNGLYGAPWHNQNSVGDTAGSGNAFGAALGFGWGERDSDAGDSFGIGAPGAASDRGEVSAVLGMAADWQQWRLDGGAAGDGYGASFAGVDSGLN